MFGRPVYSALGAAVLAVSCGCAARAPSPVNTPEVRPQTPQIDSGFAVRVETQDPELASALATLTIAQSSAQHRRVAERYYRLRILDSAYDHFLRATVLDPNDGVAFEGLARIWRDWGFAERGLGDASRAVHFAPSLPAAHNTLGRILLTLGRYDDARQAFERTLALDPAAAYAFNNLCYLSLLEGDFTLAATHCQAALDADPDFIPARNNLALSYAVSQREDLALREFIATGDPAAAAYNMGLVRQAEGDYAAAAKAFDEASRKRPAWSAARMKARQTHRLAAAAARARQQ
ncbi:MAG TPA: tetratricopeptide repeat protein [Vicinamibacterales bacterium]|nr:tetratricopeptide repeat protein [Vicinamibacterales bacterium]